MGRAHNSQDSMGQGKVDTPQDSDGRNVGTVTTDADVGI